MVCVHRFVLEYIEEFLNSVEYFRFALLGQNNIVINVSDEEILEKGLLSLDIRNINSGFYTLSRISVSANYFNPENYVYSPVIVGNCQVNLVSRGSNDVFEMLIKRDMGPHHVNCGTIFNKKIYFEDSSVLNIFKHGFDGCELILESMYHINSFNKNYCFENNIYNFKHLFFDINYNSSVSLLENAESLLIAYNKIQSFVNNFNSKILIKKCDLILKQTDLKTRLEYDSILSMINYHLEFLNSNFDIIFNDNLKLNLVIEEIDPVIEYYRALDTELFKLNKSNVNRFYKEILTLYTSVY